jgi:molybdopterin-biosynthesis enzyme MoeA-like protein
MLPQGSEVLDNPIGTAYGFAVDIGQARFFFTPGVPCELRRMLEREGSALREEQEGLFGREHHAALFSRPRRPPSFADNISKS